jgi:ParB-like chromosome segregation protein Spo0J
MNTFKQMIKEGVIKRADRGQHIRWEDIHIEPGFNPAGRHDAEDEDDISLRGHIKAGGTIPPLEVRPRAEGGVWLVDGHRRYVQLGKALEEGCTTLLNKDGELRVDIVQFEGSDIDRVARIATSNSNKKLTPLQLGQVYKRLRGMKKTPDEIAAIVSKTRQHVDQMLILADANHDVQEAVAAGDISATEAVKLQRQHGDNTGEVIRKAKDAAQGKRVTAKLVKPWTPPAKVLTPAMNALESFLCSVPKEVRAIIEKADEYPERAVSVNAKELLDLFKAHNDIEDARKAADEKQRAKDAQAAQGELAGTDGA